MRRGPIGLAWILFAAWSTWLLALEGRLAAGVHPFTPDVTLALLVALAPRLASADLRRAALLVALARIALSVDPPAAILSGYLGAAAILAAARSVAALDSVLVRALVAFAVALALELWLGVARAVRVPQLPVVPSAAFAAALATAVLAGLFAPVLARLPGLTPLRRRRPWPTAVSFT